MSPKYTSLEDGQVIETDEPRADLDALARWERDDSPPTKAPNGPAAPGATPVAGAVNTNPETGGNPPLKSTSAGFSNPAEIIDSEEARRRADQAAADAAAAAQAEREKGETPNSSDDEPERPVLNGTTEDWAAFAKHPSIALDIEEGAGRDAIVAAYIEKFAPSGNASGADWKAYADKHGVSVDEKDGRDKIRAAVVEAGWAKA